MRPHHARITLHNATLVLPAGVERARLHIAGGRIAAHASPGAWALDLRDHLIFPGLVNAHDHLHLNNVPPLPQQAPFPNSYAWIAAFERYFDDPAVAAAVAVPKATRFWQGGLKNLLAGVTTVAHHDSWHPALDDPAFPLRVLRDFGWSHSLGLGLEARDLGLEAHGKPQAASRKPLPRYGPPVVASFRATPPERPWIIHLAEGTDAIAAAELALLDGLGCLGANTVLVHGAGLSAADMELTIVRGAAVVWCPASNIALLGRTLDPRRLAGAGRLALGSDSRQSGARDLLDELRVAAAQSDLDPHALLRLATTGAAGVLRLPDAGALLPGYPADLLIIRDQGGDPYAQLVDITRKSIRAVVRGGRPVIADPDLAEWFAMCDVEAAEATLDGQPKLIARTLARAEAVALETGLVIVG
jgi:cytosine/adenosine deaminase-related metal-dependent hydrolase